MTTVIGDPSPSRRLPQPRMSLRPQSAKPFVTAAVAPRADSKAA